MIGLHWVMFSREEVSRTKQEFWIAFGKYMSPVPSSEGVKVNWINYHTGVKGIYFRIDAGARAGTISISIEHPDQAIQELYFDQFRELKTVLHQTLGEDWYWRLHESIEGKTLSRIYSELSGVSVMNKDQWSDLISFFKPRIIALDRFWEHAKYSFEGLNTG